MHNSELFPNNQEELFEKSLDSIISSYIWNGKPPCLCKVFLWRPKHNSGKALPNFKLYY